MAIVAAAVHAGWHYLAAQVVATLAGLPHDVSVLELTMLATAMPFLGRS